MHVVGCSRRQKRILLRDKNVGCIWRNTPSPPPGEQHQYMDDTDDTDDEEAKKMVALQMAKNGAKEKEEGDEEESSVEGKLERDEEIVRLQAQELELFTSWLEETREIEKLEAEKRAREEEEDKMVGPVPIVPEGVVGFEADYGTHLRPGEGSAMAAYVQQGARIPRRGEVGLDASQIEMFEKIGYVMSGNRNAKMNAVRIRKENQVYTAEEKAALAMLNFEENKRKEAKILEDMKKLVEKTVDNAGK